MRRESAYLDLFEEQRVHGILVSPYGDIEARLAVAHLLATGRRRLVFAGGPLDVRQISDRLTGALRMPQDIALIGFDDSWCGRRRVASASAPCPARPGTTAHPAARIGRMTNPPHDDAVPSEAVFAPTRPGRGLAGAIAVFLGGYLLLAGFSGLLGQASLSLFATLSGRPGPEYPGGLMTLAVLQFLFALIVVVGGLLIGRVSATGALVGAIVVVVGSILTFAVLGLRVNGLLPFPGGRDGIPFQAVFANPWFAIVLFVGIGWLLARRAGIGWLTLLGTVLLIPVPIALQFASIESGIIQIVMFLLAGVVGAGIVFAGRPLRD